jgi:hypothetical protein
MHFEHIATRIPLTVRLTFKERVLIFFGYEGRVVDSVMSKNNIFDADYFYDGVSNGK